ncbi:MAG: hypothetical protein K2N10_07925 [Muribaculaceae bacterium]|nr:hypothetical protein [Muribaculaceae bacterium]
MRFFSFITSMLLLAASGGNMSAQGIGEYADALAKMPGYRARVTYSVTLPQAQDDVVYTIDLAQDPADPDGYLIEWSVMSPSGPVSGFTSWFNGDFYNFRNHRLQELHRQWDPETVSGEGAAQNSAQFASLLPTRIAAWLRAKRPVVVSGTILDPDNHRLTYHETWQSQGEIGSDIIWVFDSETMRPLLFTADYNPGSVAGQQVVAEYSYPDSLAPLAAPLSESFLHSRFPDAFNKYRESQFAIETMRGLPLPSCPLPRLDGGRLARPASDPFRAPPAIVLFDPESSLAPELISAMRASVDRLPVNAEILWAAVSKNPESAASLLSPLRDGETAITGADPLAADCGVAALPVILVCNPQGSITNLVIGLNQTLQTDVMQMLINAK